MNKTDKAVKLADAKGHIHFDNKNGWMIGGTAVTDPRTVAGETSRKYGNRIAVNKVSDGEYKVSLDGKTLMQYERPLEPYTFSTAFTAMRAAEQMLDDDKFYQT